ncbi:hypothetical protein [Paludibaculum fermentans]|uniref:NIPSNAP domain-containing protein n=1 Tax=Paludibaculum fermentans TaxID=1473598 RepID=A0A7S7NRD1_PALFE|nr:hypothetical protein [Paludibaculum fermentans]QOY88415.1 hypothetical protein IRI77_00160 [Paludibaculum fermentans]
MTMTRRACVLSLGCLALLLPLPAQQQRMIRSIVRYRLKPDRINDFNAVMRERAALLKKAGSERYFTVWVAQSGPREVGIVRFHQKWSELTTSPDPKMAEHAAAMANLTSRMNACIESMERIIDEIQPDISLPRPGTPPPFVQSGKLRAEPGKLNDVLAMLKEETLPAVKKGGATTWGVARTRFGAPTNEIHTYTGMSGWSELDQPSAIRKALGEEGFQKYLAKMGSMLTSVEYTIYSLNAEMSHMPPAQ